MNRQPIIKAVDLFCGAGGLTHGLIQAGINVVSGYDIEESCRFAYEYNNSTKFIRKDIADLEAVELSKYFENSDFSLLAGCAPCQPFSSYSRAKDAATDSRWNLLAHFGRLVEECSPHFVTMENVPGLIRQPIFQDFIDTLKKNSYELDYKVVFCPDYGMAQTRRRLVLVGSKIGPIRLINPTHTPEQYLKVDDIIQGLPKLRAGETCKKDPLHKASILSPLNLERIKASKPGGSWLDWPAELQAACHKKDSGQSYSNVYGRMSWDDLAPTITTQCNGYGNGRFGHPEEDRAISLREAALLQSFPSNYLFSPPKEKTSISAAAKMIGNAVPVRLGEVVGESILSSLPGKN